MFFNGLRENENVIEVNTNDALQDKVLKDFIHHHLKCGRTVRKTKEHYQGFEQPVIHPKCALSLIALLHPNIVVAPSDIQLCEVATVVKLINEFGDQWERVAILHCHCVEHLIVLYEVKQTVLLLDEEDGGHHRRLQRTYLTSLKVFDNEFIKLFLLFQSEQVDLTVTGLHTRNQFDHMIPRLSHMEHIK
jgi:hypothetical protein